MKTQELFPELKERSILTILGKIEDPFDGRIAAHMQKLDNLDGSPKKLTGYFHVGSNHLRSLKGGPEFVGGNFLCHVNKLQSLEGGPTYVGGEYFCGDNELTSLKGAPTKIFADFVCDDNYLTSLEDVPSSIAGNFICSSNKLTSLKGIHKQIHSIGGYADFSHNPITSHVLGLLRIKGLKSVSLSNRKVEIIINSCLGKKIDIFACQEKLIEAGFEDFAQL